MRTVRTRDNDSQVCNLEQWEIVGRIAQSQHPRVGHALVIFQGLQSIPFADPSPKQMRQAVPLNNREPPGLSKGNQPSA